jgi:glycosyltransferase involved in cell wall biosynthesis
MAVKGLSKILKVPSVATIHTIYNLDERPLLRRLVYWTLRDFPVILVVAQRAANELVRAGIPSERTRVFTYWVDQDRFRPLNKEQCKEIVDWKGKFVVLFVGRLVRAKGIWILAESTAFLDDGIKVAFITTGTYTDFMRTVGQVSNRMIYIGPVDYLRLHVYYNAADVLAVPSVFEGFARVNIEAMSCGTPVIASNVGCLPEVFGSDASSLIEPKPEAFARLMNHYYRHQDELKRVSERYLDYARMRFGEDNALVIEKGYYGAIWQLQRGVSP